MSVEMAPYCPFCPAVHGNGTNREGIATPFGTLTLNGMDAVMDSSALARHTISTIQAINRQIDPPNLPALGLTTVFSLVRGAVDAHSGWHESELMVRIGDAVGRVIANLKWVRGAIQTFAGALY